VDKGAHLTVLFDGACPLCQREIRFWRRRPGADAISWVDISVSDTSEVAPGLARSDALARFHVIDTNGAIVSGGPAFARLWGALPGFRWLGQLFQTAPCAWFLERGYRLFLRMRPGLQRLAGRLESSVHGARPRWLVRDLRSDHAGETGAVAIYRGILAVSRSKEIRHFAAGHLDTESQHLRLIESALPAPDRSRLLGLWRWAGFLTGALPALLGPRAVFVTIDAVETFVERHYAAQIRRLQGDETQTAVRSLLERCRADEARHRDEARHASGSQAGPVAALWGWLVGTGSAVAVGFARRI
jgi:demethoxyubiquinone hydroxylase (CLK1/Coq7/Cat5 family)